MEENCNRRGGSRNLSWGGARLGPGAGGGAMGSGDLDIDIVGVLF